MLNLHSPFHLFPLLALGPLVLAKETSLTSPRAIPTSLLRRLGRSLGPQFVPERF